MTCYRPLIRIELQNVFVRKKDGSLTKKAKILSREQFEKYETIHKNETEEIKVMEIPCGHCIGCRLDYSREWANRCTLEAKKHKNNYFITLTYDEEHLPEGGTLIKKDLQDFIKRLRATWEYKYNEKEIKFYACGEYGGKTERPHYHVILFNMPIKTENLQPYKINEQHEMLYKCRELDKIWGKGFVTVGGVSWNSCAYVARYMTKKHKGPGAEKYYKEKGIIPEFCTMSRRPGIGRAYYEENKEEIYWNDEITIPTKSGVTKVKPSKYYDKLYDQEQPEIMESIKKDRENAIKKIEQVKMSKTTIDKKQQLRVEEEEKQMKSKTLLRGIEL